MKKDSEPLPKYKDIHEMIGDMAGNLIQEVIKKESTDNLTVVIIGLNGLKCYLDNIEIINNTAMTAQQVNKNQKNISNIENAIGSNVASINNKQHNLFIKFNKSNTNTTNPLLLVPQPIKNITNIINPMIERGNKTTTNKDKMKFIVKQSTSKIDLNENK